MEILESDILSLSQYLSQTLNPDSNIRKTAEQILKSLEANQSYPIIILKIIDKESLDVTIRMSAAVVFKNYVKNNWKPDQDSEDDKMSENVRETIKSLIIELMLRSNESVQKQLSDTITIIGKHDFPEKWPNLLNEMINKFSTGNFSIINGALRTVHSLFKKYRYEFKSQKLWTEIKFVLDTFARPLTDLFMATMELSETQTSAQALSVIYNSLLFICKIFYSLNFQDLPEFFEDNLGTWMKHFESLLTKNVPALSSDDEDDGVDGVIEEIRSQICENLVMYASKYDEEFASYLPKFVETVWNLLTSLDSRKKFDILTTNALMFLSTVADRKSYQYLFENPEVLKSICEKVFFPNIKFRTCDEEMFEDNPEEYIRRDIEGSDVGTRKKAACDLIKVLAKFLEPEIKVVFLTYLDNMLKTYSSDSSNWRCKNAAIYLVTSLEVRGQTQKYGVTQISNFVNLADFAVEHIMPELEKANVNEFAVIKADCIRYIMTFRNILPRQLVTSSLVLVTKHLIADSKVVHSYAAVCIDKILTIRDPSSQKFIVNASELSTVAEHIFNGLFVILSKSGSEENEYAMKAILRTIYMLNEKSIPFLERILPNLIRKLEAVSKNPSNPQFNHALFEAIALCIKIVCTNLKDTDAITSFESVLFPVFQVILQQDVLEFLPYIFQLLSMLLEFRVKGDPVPLPYWELYQFLLSPVLWERSGNIHPLVRLITAYISRVNSSEIESKLQLNALLGIFKQLVCSKANDREGLYLLQVLIECCPNEILVPNMKQIFIILLQRLTEKKTDKYVRGLTVFLCFYIINYGASNMINLLESLQTNLFVMIVEKILLNEISLQNGLTEKKIVIVGLSKLLSEAKELIEGPYLRLWAPLLKIVFKTLEANEQEAATAMKRVEEIAVAAELTSGSFEVVYSKLMYASKPEYDPLQGIGDVTSYVTQKLLNLSKMYPERIVNLIKNTDSLSADDQQVLLKYLNAIMVVQT